MNPALKTLSGETQRIATDALAQGTLSKEDLLAAVVLLKTQRNDARAGREHFRWLLSRVLVDHDLDIGKFLDATSALPTDTPMIADIRAALRVTP